MEIEILVSQQCRSCASEVARWKPLCDARQIPLAVCDVGSPRGRELVARLDLKVLPAVMVDGVLRAVGVQSLEEVETLLNG